MGFKVSVISSFILKLQSNYSKLFKLTCIIACMLGVPMVSPAKMCVVELPFKLYCTVNVYSKFTASIKEKYLSVVNKTISLGIPENLLNLLIRFVQNLTSTFSSWS